MVFVCWRIRFPMTFASVFLSVPMVSGHNCFGSVLYPVRTHTYQKPSNSFFLSLNWNRCRSQQQQTVRWQMSRTPCLMDTLRISPPHTFERLAEQAMKCTRLAVQRTMSSEHSTLHKISVLVHVILMVVVLPLFRRASA